MVPAALPGSPPGPRDPAREMTRRDGLGAHRPHCPSLRHARGEAATARLGHRASPQPALLVTSGNRGHSSPGKRRGHRKVTSRGDKETSHNQPAQCYVRKRSTETSPLWLPPVSRPLLKCPLQAAPGLLARAWPLGRGSPHRARVDVPRGSRRWSPSARLCPKATRPGCSVLSVSSPAPAAVSLHPGTTQGIPRFSRKAHLFLSL